MKRPNGKGSIEVRADGRARIRAMVDGKRRQVGPVFPNEEAAAVILDAWNAEVAAQTIVAPREVTIALLGAELLNQRELGGSRHRDRVRSIESERSVFRRHVLPSELASMPLETVRASDLDAFVRWLRTRKAVSPLRKGAEMVMRETKRPISTQTQRHALRIVRQILDEAVRLDVLAKNPAAMTRVARGVSTTDGWDWLRPSEIDALLSCEALSLRDRAAFAVAIFGGLRLNEDKRVELADVHLDATVPGPHIVIRFGTSGGPTKSGRVHRVPVLPALAGILRQYIATRPTGARLLFSRDDGDPYSDGYDFGWAPKLDRGAGTHHLGALAVAGIARRVRFHDLRHTCGTNLAAGTWGRRWTAPEIKSFLGHSDLRVTERYIHIAGEALAAAARETTGGVPLPPVAPAKSANYLRTQKDSNLRPLAPEANALSS